MFGRSFMKLGCVTLTAVVLAGCASTPKMVSPSEEDKALISQREKAIELSKGTPGQEFAGRLNNSKVKESFQKIENDEKMPAGFWNWQKRDIKNAIEKALEGPTWPRPPIAVIPKAKGKININGKIDDEAWKNALTYKGLYKFNTKEKLDSPGMTWKLLWDDEYLYVAYECEDKNIIAPERKRDDAVYSDDCVEIFILPDFRYRTYWELIVSPSNSIYDSVQCKKIDQWGSNHDPSQTIEGLKVGIDIKGTINNDKDEDEKYTVELAIPFNQLPGFTRAKPKVGDTFYFMLVRLDKLDAKKMNAYSYQPLLGWGHNIWNHAHVKLAK